MIDIGKWALKNHLLIRFIVIVMVIGGSIAFYNMSKLEDPEIKVKQAMVVTTYPGASAHEVELEVTDPIEKSIRSMYNINSIESRSMNDLSIINVELVTTTPADEVEQFYDILRRKVNDIQGSLPKGVGESIVLDDFGDVYGMFYAITGEGFSDTELGNYADLAKQEFQNIPGISKVSIYGKRVPSINIEIHQDRMANLGVHPAEVLSTLNGQNNTVYAGYYDTPDKRVKIKVSDRYKSVEAIGNLLIQGHEDDQLRLKDIADISSGYEEPARNQMFHNNQRALGISIAAQQNTDITKLGKSIESKIEELKSEHIPAGIDFHKVFFQPERVTNALTTFLINLLESVAIVILILMITMGIRSGVIIGISLIVIIFGSIMILGTLDGTLQRVSLGSLIVAMGMLVDNAIVIIDGILVDLAKGMPRQTALTSIGKKTAMPLLGATLIAILAFLPIFLSPDTAGVYVRDLFIVLAVSLLLSWILALTHVPVMAERWLKRVKNQPGEDPYNTPAYKLLRSTLKFAIRHKKAAVICAVALVCTSIYCYRFIPQEFFPDMNYEQCYIEYKLDEGSSPQKVEKELKEISTWLLKQPYITNVTTSLGGTPSRYNLVRSIATPSLSYGELIVDFTSPEELISHIDSIQNYLTANYPDAYSRVKRYNLMYKKFPIEVKFSGPDPAILKQLTQQAEDIMNNSPYTRLVCNDWSEMQPVMEIEYNQPTARRAGLSRSDVALSLLTANGGIPTGSFYIGKERCSIYLKSVDSKGNPINELDNTPIFSSMPPLQNLNKETLTGLFTGSVSEQDILAGTLGTTPLNQAVKGINIKWDEPIVIRYNGVRAMRAQCEPISGYTAESARSAIAPAIEAIDLPDGYSYSWEGEYQASKQSTRYLFGNFPLAIVAMIAILIMLFKDYKKPIIIFSCVPLLLVGVVFGILLSGKSFGFVAIVGVLGLIGMMIKNGVVLMDEIEIQRSEGKSAMQAVIDSSSSRFRPVMMASLTTILGMIPLIGDELFGSLAVTIMAGLFVGTTITLLFIPVLYSLFFKIDNDTKQ